ncbi:MAG: glycosyltransferase, partial [Bryobacteraceae bacterium]|nr:glycosyltransferase [Bryobacteraceae bacterium]
MIAWLLLAAAAVALLYQSGALAAAAAFHLKTRLLPQRPPAALPPISILKPVYGLDPQLEEAVASHLALDYPEYELLLGFQRPDDPAIPVLRQLLAKHPERHARIEIIRTEAKNAKTGVLEGLSRLARHPVIVVNDADITVPKDYLRRLAASLEQPGVGVVTCLYRARASSLAGCFEALGIATDFMPSALVAPFVGVREFGFGSTLCFRRADLEAIGGFRAFDDYIADDYQLASRIAALGKRAVFAEIAVLTYLADPDWRAVWRHQLRWARTIRYSRPGGFAGMPVTHAGLWALLNLAAGNLGAAAALWLARSVMGAFAGFAVLGHWPALAAAPLIPLWDLFAFAIWAAAWCGNTAWWRGHRIRLGPKGRILENQV